MLLNKNELHELPTEIFQLGFSLQKLSLFGNPMNRIRMIVYEKCRYWTSRLDLSNMRIGADEASRLPRELFCGLTKLKNLVLSNNNICILPSNISQLSSLEVLDLENNRLNVLPWQLGLLTNLKKLKLEGNPLRKIPEVILKQRANHSILLTYLSQLKDKMDESYRYAPPISICYVAVE